MVYPPGMQWPWQRVKRVLTPQEEARLVEAIRRAEQGNRGEVLVHVERRCVGGNALARAMALFEKRVRQTAADTGVILYVAVERIGGLLRTVIPGEDVAGNELPDRVSQG
jgi:uncharacterized membrane protein